MEIETMLAVLSGGLAGAYFSFRLNSSRYRTELSLKIIEKIDNNIEKIEEAYSILNGVCEDGNIWESDPNIRKHKFDMVILNGDYLDTAAYLYLSYNVNRDLFKNSKICLILDEFIALLKNFKTSKYNIEKNEYEPQKWEEAWPYLEHYRRKKTYKWELFKRVLLG